MEFDARPKPHSSADAIGQVDGTDGRPRMPATWNHPAPHWVEMPGAGATAPAYWGRCRKKVYRTHDHAASDARAISRDDGRRDAADAYWCRSCRGFHVGRPVGSRHERHAVRTVERRPIDQAEAA